MQPEPLRSGGNHYQDGEDKDADAAAAEALDAEALDIAATAASNSASSADDTSHRQAAAASPQESVSDEASFDEHLAAPPTITDIYMRVIYITDGRAYLNGRSRLEPTCILSGSTCNLSDGRATAMTHHLRTRANAAAIGAAEAA